MPTKKIAKGALEDPARLLEYSDVLRGIGVILHPREVSMVGSDKVLLEAEALIYGKLDPDAGRIFITPPQSSFIASSEFVALKVAPSRAKKEFVKAVLLLPECCASLRLLKGGKCQQRADFDKISRCSMPLPALDAQDRILGQIAPFTEALDQLARQIPSFREIVDRGLAGIVPVPPTAETRVVLSGMGSISAGPLLRCGYRYLSMTEKLSSMLLKMENTVPLGALAEVRGGKRVPPRITQYRTEATGYRFLRGSDIGHGRVKVDQLANIDKAIYARIAISAPLPTEVLLTVAGVVGKAACATGLRNVAVTDNVSLIRPRNPNELDPEFLMYLLLSSFMQFQIRKEMSELRQQKIGLDKLRSLRLPEIPSIGVQLEMLGRIRSEFEEAQQLKSVIASTKADMDHALRSELGITPALQAETFRQSEAITSLGLEASDEIEDEEDEEEGSKGFAEVVETADPGY